MSCAQRVRPWDHSWRLNAPQYVISSKGDLISIETRLTAALREVLGFQQFRVGQLAAASAVLMGKDVVVKFPTSGGKSLCYILPSVCLPDLTLVISPLISLMDEQVRR